jgi:hypothetical protein
MLDEDAEHPLEMAAVEDHEPVDASTMSERRADSDVTEQDAHERALVLS